MGFKFLYLFLCVAINIETSLLGRTMYQLDLGDGELYRWDFFSFELSYFNLSLPQSLLGGLLKIYENQF